MTTRGTSYTNPLTLSYGWPAVDFGGGADIVQRIKGPAGKKGRIVDVSVEATEAFNSPTNPAHVLVGIASDTDSVLDWNVGDVDVNTVVNASTSINPGLNEVPADTLVLVTLQAVTGTSPTGTGNVRLFIDWF